MTSVRVLKKSWASSWLSIEKRGAILRMFFPIIVGSNAGWLLGGVIQALHNSFSCSSPKDTKAQGVKWSLPSRQKLSFKSHHFTQNTEALNLAGGLVRLFLDLLPHLRAMDHHLRTTSPPKKYHYGVHRASHQPLHNSRKSCSRL